MREVRGVDPIGFLRRFGLGARGQERMAAHVGRFVDQKRRPRLAALDARERAGRTGVEHRDPHVGRDQVEAIAQRRGRSSDRRRAAAPSRRRAPSSRAPLRCARRRRRGVSLGDAPRQRVERVDQFLELRLPQHDFVGRHHAAELDHHPREPLGVGDGVLQPRAIGAAGIGPDDERVALQRSGGGGRAGNESEGDEQDRDDRQASHGRFSFWMEKLDCSRSAGRGSAAGGVSRWLDTRRLAASTIGATANGSVPVMK